MLKKTVLRILQLILILLALSFLVFTLMYFAPGNAAEKRLSSGGVAITKEVLDAEIERLGLAKPLLTRYGEWLLGVFHGNLGVSLKDDLPIWPKLANGLKKTVVLAGSALLLSLLISVPLGIIAAVKRSSIIDRIICFFSFVGNSLPSFLIAILLMYLFCIRLGILPVIADSEGIGLILPAISLAIPLSARFTRQIRAEVITQLDEDYITGIQSRGVKQRFVIFSNALYMALGHILTIVGLSVGALMGGSVVIETIFRWPGIGKLVMDSITARDYPVIMGFVLFMGTIFVVINLITDIIYHSLDPRV